MIDLNKELLDLAKESIAFNDKVVEKLNKKMAQIDSRLYLFAYYQPKQLPDKIDSRSCFNLAIFNMYGLLWDCGAMVRNRLFLSAKRGQVPEAVQTLVDEKLGLFKQFYYIISNIRTCMCHNNSILFFHNRVKSDGCKKYLKDITGKSSALDSYNESEWVEVCKDFLIKCNEFEKMLDNFLDRLLQEADLKKTNDFINYWIEAIIEWYQQDMELIAHVLADKYKLKKMSISRQNNVNLIKKSDVIYWIGTAWKAKKTNNSLMKMRDYYLDYVSDCLGKIHGILAEQNCPKPALPLEVLVKATADVQQFKLLNRSRFTI